MLADAGSSFSPHGFGLGMRLAWERVHFDIGYGILSKADKLGHPLSIDLGLHVVQKLAGAEARKRIAAQMDYPYGPA